MGRSKDRYIISAFFLIAVLFSCTSPKQTTYFQGLPASRIDTVKAMQPHVIKPYDLIQISVTSLNPEADLAFEKSSLRQDNYVSGYLVDSTGSIDLPYIGRQKVSGYTAANLKEVLREKLVPYLKSPSINVRMLNFRISVLGEVARPGSFTIPNEKISLPEALSLAGDLTIVGKRENVLVIREVDGERRYERIDLRKNDLFTSPYYYLQSNDIVYVEPGKGKIADADFRRWQILTFAATLATLVVLIITSTD